jgi:hypothetical protein
MARMWRWRMRPRCTLQIRSLIPMYLAPAASASVSPVP